MPLTVIVRGQAGTGENAAVWGTSPCVIVPDLRPQPQILRFLSDYFAEYLRIYVHYIGRAIIHALGERTI